MWDQSGKKYLVTTLKTWLDLFGCLGGRNRSNSVEEITLQVPSLDPRSRRSGKTTIAAPGTPGDFRRSPRSGYKIADIWHVRYRRLNSPVFAKCTRSRNFLLLLLRIASKVNPSGWAILSHDFSKLPHRRDRPQKSPGESALIGGEIFASDHIRRDRRIKSPGVSPALESFTVQVKKSHSVDA